MRRCFSLPEPMWFAFRAGEAYSRACAWMGRARDHKQVGHGQEAVSICVRAAREKHREYCRFLTQARAANGDHA